MILGIDIGGTKCAVITARADGENIELLDKRKIPTRLDISPDEMIECLILLADEMLDGERAEKIGISCAAAEWKFGAGKGTQNMIFLTFGTGLGAGLILNGRLYSGTETFKVQELHLPVYHYLCARVEEEIFL